MSLVARSEFDEDIIERFEGLLDLTREVLSTSIAAVMEVRSNQIKPLVMVGVDPKSAPEMDVFCTLAVQSKEAIIIEDASLDSRIKDHLMVSGSMGVRFYAGIPILDQSGNVLGTLCSISTEPKKLSPQKVQNLLLLARQAGVLFELKSISRDQLTRSFFDSAPMLMGVVEVIGQDILHLSDNLASYSFFGASHGSLQGRMASEIGVPSATLATWVSHYKESETSGRPITFEYDHLKASRKHRLSATVNFIKRINNERSRFSYIVQDITTQKAQQLDLQEATDKLAVITSNIGEVIWITDPKKNEMVYISSSYEKIWERTCKDLYSNPMSFVEAIHPEDRERVIAQFPLQVQGKYEVTYRIVSPSGKIKWISDRAFPVKDHHGNVYRVVGIASDITDQYIQERELRENKEKLETIVNHIPVMLSLHDKSGNVEWVNAEWTRVLGWTLEDSKNPSTLSKIFASDEERLAAIQHRLMPQREWVDYRLRNQAGEEISTAWANVQLSSGKTISIGKDVSLERAQEKIIEDQQLKMISNSKLSSLGAMAGGIAHEINNPLSIIQASSSILSDLAKSGDITGDSLNKHSERIQKTTERIAKIVRGLRFFAREGSNDPFVPTPLGQIIQDTLELCQLRFSNNGVELRVGDTGTVFNQTLECRPIQISQVLVNLLNNSFDAVHGMQSPWVEISCLDHDQWIEVSVTDSGKGLSPEAKSKWMDPFFTTKAIGKGMGLGLSISIGIISAHGGSLSLDEKSPNTKFVIKLPKIQKARSHGT